jgi:hypothetical protein
MPDDDYDYDDDINTDWIQTAANTLCTSTEYSPIPSIRMVLLTPSGYEVKTIARSDFAGCAIPTGGNIIRDIAIFSFDIQKHQLPSAGGGRYTYESMDSIEKVRERLVRMSAFPCFFDLFEIVVVLDAPALPVSALRRGGGKTRKSVRFHHSCTRRVPTSSDSS